MLFSGNLRTSINTAVDSSPSKNSSLLGVTVATHSESRRTNGLGPELVECELEWCAVVYDNASVNTTTLNLPLQKTYPLTLTGGWFGNFTGLCHVFEAGDGFPAHHNATFTIDTKSNMELKVFLSETMTVSMQTVASGFSCIEQDCSAFSLGAAVLSHPSAQDMVFNMAASMTDAIRSLAGTQAVGTAWQSVQYTNVHWQWLILPAVVTLLSAVLLGITIVQNRGSQAVIWKSSALALMFHPLTSWDEREINASSPKTMKKAARGMRGQLKDHGDQGLRIVRT